MATKRSKKKPEKSKPSPGTRNPKPVEKKPGRQPASRRDAAAETSESAAAKATRTPALLALTAAGLGALRTAIDSSAQRSGTRTRGTTAAKKRDESLSEALDRLDADYARLLR